jgi:lipopolysaccharide/colanic/teichoic acid biosynthesis glycosyltransferase
MIFSERETPVCPPVERLDRYLRGKDSVFAWLADKACSLKGEEYLNSRCKRYLDLSVAIPAAVVTSPLVISLGIAKKLEDGGSMFFVQQRLCHQPGETISLVKIRCMRPNSDKGIENYSIAQGQRADQDPRNTRLGCFLRHYQLEELPQFFQVIADKLSVIGIRPNTPAGFDYLRQYWNDERFSSWQKAYFSGPLGISGVNQLFGSRTKEDKKRYHTDIFYAKNASLGLDLYLIWKTFITLLGKA